MNEFIDRKIDQVELDLLFSEMLGRMGCKEQHTLSCSNLKHDLWVNIYLKVADYNFQEMFTLTEMFYDFNPALMDFKLTKPYSLNVCVYDLKIYRGDLYFAVYFSLNTKLGQVCLDNGFTYSVDKKIWVRKIKLGEVAQSDTFEFFQQEIKQLINEILSFSHVLINKSTLNKYFNFSFVGGGSCLNKPIE